MKSRSAIRSGLLTAPCRVAVSLLALTGAATAAYPNSSATSASRVDSFIDAWFATSDAAKEAQPHWMTPVVTVTPRLEQEYRYDQSWQRRPNFVDH
jgi:hypothetical protein